MDDRLQRFVRTTFRRLGRESARAGRALGEGRATGAVDLPRDEEGRARIVCRRHAERRAVALDDAARPACYEADDDDCEGCAEDVREGVVETW